MAKSMFKAVPKMKNPSVGTTFKLPKQKIVNPKLNFPKLTGLKLKTGALKGVKLPKSSKKNTFLRGMLGNKK